MIFKINKLPLLPADSPMVVARKNNSNAPGEHKDFRSNKNELIWLAQLKYNSSYYAIAAIDTGALDQLLVFRTMISQLRSCEENDDDNNEEDLDVRESESRPEQGNATGDIEGDEKNHVTESLALTILDHQS